MMVMVMVMVMLMVKVMVLVMVMAIKSRKSCPRKHDFVDFCCIGANICTPQEVQLTLVCRIFEGSFFALGNITHMHFLRF